MIAEAIAIAALGAAGYAVILARRSEAALDAYSAALQEAAETEIEVEPESGEIFIGNGEVYVPDMGRLREAYPEALTFSTIEGVSSALMPDGEWTLHKLAADRSKVRAIK